MIRVRVSVDGRVEVRGRSWVRFSGRVRVRPHVLTFAYACGLARLCPAVS